MSAGYKLVRLVNGTHSVHSVAHRETFHPVIGPVAEAQALYVEQLRLPERMAALAQNQPGVPFVIWDVGLGAAANVLTVLRSTRPIPCPVHLVSFDHTIEPLRFALEHRESLGYFDHYAEPVARFIESHGLTFEDGERSITWELHLADFPTLVKEARMKSLPKPHAILFDAFSPAKNPAMWTQPLFADLFALLDPLRPCALPTYSRSTMLRVSLLLAGFFVGAGHATGEKEETTIAANSLDLIQEPLDARWLKRVRNSTSAEPLWVAEYRQAPLSEATWERLLRHPQLATAPEVTANPLPL